MAGKASKKGQQTNIQVKNIHGVRGNLNITSRDIKNAYNTDGLSPVELRPLFDQIYADIETRSRISPIGKKGLKSEIDQIESTVMQAEQQHKKIKESFLRQRFRGIARIAPDVLVGGRSICRNLPEGFCC
jgi:hypothetical protein